MPQTLQGYYPIVPTCYTTDGQVDLESMRRLTNYLIENGAQGMSPNGGDSEARYLTTEERMRVTDVVLETNAGRTPVLVGASAKTTEESVQLTQHAQRAGASAVFIMPPEAWGGTLMEEVSADKMLAHYSALCEVLEIPLMIHAIKSMDVPFFETLLERFPQVKYIKEETSHGIKLRQYVRELSDRVTIFGPGLHYPAELEWGAQGGDAQLLRSAHPCPGVRPLGRGQARGGPSRVEPHAAPGLLALAHRLAGGRQDVPGAPRHLPDQAMPPRYGRPEAG